MTKCYSIRIKCPHCEREQVHSLRGLQGSKILTCEGVHSKTGCNEMFAIDWKHVPEVKTYAIIKAWKRNLDK